MAWDESKVQHRWTSELSDGKGWTVAQTAKRSLSHSPGSGFSKGSRETLQTLFDTALQTFGACSTRVHAFWFNFKSQTLGSMALYRYIFIFIDPTLEWLPWNEKNRAWSLWAPCGSTQHGCSLEPDCWQEMPFPSFPSHSLNMAFKSLNRQTHGRTMAQSKHWRANKDCAEGENKIHLLVFPDICKTMFTCSKKFCAFYTVESFHSSFGKRVYGHYSLQLKDA